MHLLVIRTSAMGDVAMLTPVIRGMRSQYPEIEMTLVTHSAFAPFFYSIPGLKLFHPDFNNRHKGIAGTFRLYRDLISEYKFDYVIDLHRVIRSWILGFLFMVTGIPVKAIDKGRAEKKLLIKGKRKTYLKHSIERYCDVFKSAGFPVSLSDGPWIIPSHESSQKVASLTELTGLLKIGMAPFTRHDLKTWPEENTIRLLSLISDRHKVKFFLFGGAEEAGKLKALSEKVSGSMVVAGHFTLNEEIALISTLDLMIAMDSANMHMAALTGTKVVSIWGGTDPMTGFGAWKQPDDSSIRIPVEELTCRPCTVYGKGTCSRGDFACMNWLTPEMVYRKLIQLKTI
jgi:ADP-heptose:LPS heptosyltransferase